MNQSKYSVKWGDGYVTPKTAIELRKLEYMNPAWFLGIIVFCSFLFWFINWWQFLILFHGVISFGYWYQKRNHPEPFTLFQDGGKNGGEYI